MDGGGDENSGEQTRKAGGGIWLPHKQLFAGGATVLFLSSIGPMLQLKKFINGDQDQQLVEIRADMNKGFDRIEHKIEITDNETGLKIRRVFDVLSTTVEKAENRCESRAAEIVSRVSNLEAYAFRRKGT